MRDVCNIQKEMNINIFSHHINLPPTRQVKLCNTSVLSIFNTTQLLRNSTCILLLHRIAKQHRSTWSLVNKVIFNFMSSVRNNPEKKKSQDSPPLAQLMKQFTSHTHQIIPITLPHLKILLQSSKESTYFYLVVLF